MKKIETKSMVLLKHHLKMLRLPTMHDECEKLAARCAKENVDHLGFLLQLCELELLDREKRAAAAATEGARFPNPKRWTISSSRHSRRSIGCWSRS